MNLDFKGFNENVATFVAEESVKAGDLVTVSDNYTVAPCADGDEIAGVCVNVRNGYATVQLSGYVEAKAETKIATGYQNISAIDNTTVKADETAKHSCLVISCDDDMNVSFIL